MAQHKDVEEPGLQFVYSIDFQVGNVIISPGEPQGTRVLIPIISGGIFQGGEGFEDFKETIESPSSGWATMYEDGSGLQLKVNFVFKTEEGGVVLGYVEGRSERLQQNKNGVGSSSEAKIHSSISFETGVEKYKWMNKKVFMGKGRKDGDRVKINYYQIL